MRLKHLGPFGGGKTPSTSISDYWGGSINWISSKEVKTKYIANTERKLTELGAESMTIYPSNSLIFVMRSGILRRTFPIAILKRESTVNQDIKVLCQTKLIDSEYIYYAILAREKYILKKCSKDGTTVESIDDEKLKNLIIPIPPLSEQRRICIQINNLLSLAVCHQELLDSVATIANNISQSLLFAAIQGKLVPQDPQDLPVQIPCKNPIIRRDNSYYESDVLVNTPFEIPKSWNWVRGADLFERQRTAEIDSDSFTYIDIDSIDNHNCIIAKPKTIKTENAPSRAKRQIKEGDVLFSLVRPYLKNIAQVTNQYSNSIASTGFFVCHSRYFDSDFLYYLMTSKYVVDGINEKMKGDNSPSVKKEDLLQFLYPLPPMNEQKRIVCKMKMLIKLVDTLV